MIETSLKSKSLPYSAILALGIIVFTACSPQNGTDNSTKEPSTETTPVRVDPAEGEEPNLILFDNVKVFNGVEDGLQNLDVLVVGNTIQQVAAEISPTAEYEIIDGGGRTLMPGLINNHAHLTFTGVAGASSYADLQNASWETLATQAAANALDQFMDGFTTVRDLCGTGQGLRDQIDAGNLVGPRLYLSTGCISPTSGHGEARAPGQRAPGAEVSWLERLGSMHIADGAEAVRKASRLNLSNGADFLKLMAGGGVSSTIDPLYSHAYNQAELEAAVESAEFFDTYVTVHAYNDRSVTAALDAGVKVIEHGQMMSEASVKRIADKEVFWSMNAAGMNPDLAQHPNFAPGTPSGEKFQIYVQGSQNVFDYIRKHRPKIVFNVDTVLSPMSAGRAQRDNEIWVLSQNLGNFETLKAMTSVAGELAQLTNQRNPYPGKLGVVEVGAYADLLLVEGNPLEDIRVLGANENFVFDAPPREQGHETLKIIMKDGVIYKNAL